MVPAAPTGIPALPTPAAARRARLRDLIRRLLHIVVLLAGIGLLGGLAYLLWSPGSTAPLPPGQHGVWLGHAWWGDLTWYAANPQRRAEDHQGEVAVAELARDLHDLDLRDWYVHAAPCRASGALPTIDLAQARLLVAANPDGAVLAWVGGMLDGQCFPADPAWRGRFAASCAELVAGGGLAGIQLNIEPCPSFTPGYLELLDELRRVLPPGSRLSIAAYPPPSSLHPAPEVHWDEAFYRAVSARCDDLAVMAYDTALRMPKTFIWLVREWTDDATAWSSVPVRIGLSAYEDDEPWHDPTVETLANGLAGVAAAESAARLAGIAVYTRWTLDEAERGLLRERLVHPER